MKHKFKITPRGKKTKYYTCVRCNIQIIATSLKQADKLGESCYIVNGKE